MRVVVKIGTSSLTDESGALSTDAIAKVCDEVARADAAGASVTLVTSAAISAGLPPLGFSGTRPKDTTTLQVAAAVGQSRLMAAYDEGLATHRLTSGQILLSARDFFDRRQYLLARSTLERMLEMGVVPVVNENDAVCNDEIRWGDNDRLAALVAHAVGAELLLLLTDTDGLFTADPRVEPAASLVSEVTELDQQLNAVAGGPGSSRGSGGMASKLAAARMASRAGIRAVISNASRPGVVGDAIAGHDIGTMFVATSRPLPARKLWIAYALAGSGRLQIDDGACSALEDGGKSLLPGGITSIDGTFAEGDGVEIVDSRGAVLAKGVVRMSSERLRALVVAGFDAPQSTEVVHRDDLVVLR